MTITWGDALNDMNFLMIFFLAALSADKSSERLSMKGIVESYDIGAYHVYLAPPERSFSMDIATIRLLESKSLSGKTFTLTLDPDKRLKWNRPKAVFRFSILPEDLEKYFSDSNSSFSDFYLKDVVFEK